MPRLTCFSCLQARHHLCDDRRSCACSVCHGKAARRMRDGASDRRSKPGPKPSGKTHGIESTYRHGCRCVPCREAATVGQRKRNERKRKERLGTWTG